MDFFGQVTAAKRGFLPAEEHSLAGAPGGAPCRPADVVRGLRDGFVDARGEFERHDVALRSGELNGLRY